MKNYERVDYMSDSFNKRISELFGKMDERIVQAKIASALDMLNSGNIEELARRINKMDKDDLIEKINNFDESKLKELNVDKNEIKKRINNADLDRLAALLGERGNELTEKFKALLQKI
ncbi:UNVERIFIED_CONTAM: hypothetical protein Cloal_1719 [Acetivibrio alkalicellulosi]